MAALPPQKPGRYFCDNWERQSPKFYAEILFEKEFIPHYPWRPLPISQYQLKRISALCHVTHQCQAQSISRNPKEEGYIFAPGPKKGKCGYYVTDGSPLGESYRCNLNGSNPDENTSYMGVSSAEHLLPMGNYSWWGVEPVCTSLYGSHKFSVDFKQILKAFQQSHKRPGQNPSVIFRKAGTLRYRREICYVILVHVSTDAHYVHHLPPVTNMESRFPFHDLLNEQGVVTNWEANHPIFVEAATVMPSCENVAFAFYFSSDHGQLRIAQEDVAHSPVYHQYCIKKFALDGKWVCPDVAIVQ